jgi:hypothetical protein
LPKAHDFDTEPVLEKIMRKIKSLRRHQLLRNKAGFGRDYGMSVAERNRALHRGRLWQKGLNSC